MNQLTIANCNDTGKYRRCVGSGNYELNDDHNAGMNADWAIGHYEYLDNETNNMTPSNRTTTEDEESNNSYTPGTFEGELSHFYTPAWTFNIDNNAWYFCRT